MAGRDVLVFCYHGIAPESRHGEVAPAALRAQLQLVADRGYSWTTFTDAVLGDHDGRMAAVTFDDGIASAIEHGLPVLDELGAPGTMFLRLDLLGVSGRLGVADASRLVGLGWEIGSHTVNHPVLTKVDDASLRDELVLSKGELERLTGRTCTSVAYPTGRADARVVSAAAAAGYVAGAALEGATSVRPGPLAWPRVGVRGDDTLRVFGLKSSRSVRRMRSSWAHGPVGKLATAAGRARRRL